MALINCKECKKKVSTEANSCPHCGVSSPAFLERGEGEIFTTCSSLLCSLRKKIIAIPEVSLGSRVCSKCGSYLKFADENY